MARRTRPAAGPPLPDVISIDALLEECGLDTLEAKTTGRRLLEAAGLTSSRKQNLSIEKRDAAAAIIEEQLRPVCGSCAKSGDFDATDGRQSVEVAGPTCEVCGGRSTTRALLQIELALPPKGLKKLLIVGGSPPIHDELRRGLADSGIDLSIVDGHSVQGANRATALAEWADVIVIWGSSILKHKTSASFQKTEYRRKTVTLRRRGIEALSQELVKHAAGR